ncbi:TonB family protein [Oxynema sp. CENA135]|uniref:energy transducer TonB n=1 Tax=Oxynema sp. CENA135 TaxID=984206 RepID=UPI0019095BE6|nr:energy transducer TonB [Oxynema sp. CENA135]MBK4729016.1 TonB family protein [Oxynema sp. CENA135]
MSVYGVYSSQRERQEKQIERFIGWSLLGSIALHVAILPLGLQLLAQEPRTVTEEAIEFIVVEEPEVEEPEVEEPEVEEPPIEEPPIEESDRSPTEVISENSPRESFSEPESTPESPTEPTRPLFDPPNNLDNFDRADPPEIARSISEPQEPREIAPPVTQSPAITDPSEEPAISEPEMPESEISEPPSSSFDEPTSPPISEPELSSPPNDPIASPAIQDPTDAIEDFTTTEPPEIARNYENPGIESDFDPGSTEAEFYEPEIASESSAPAVQPPMYNEPSPSDTWDASEPNDPIASNYNDYSTSSSDETGSMAPLDESNPYAESEIGSNAPISSSYSAPISDSTGDSSNFLNETPSYDDSSGSYDSYDAPSNDWDPGASSGFDEPAIANSGPMGDLPNSSSSGSGSGSVGCINCGKPSYPDIAREQGWEGEVLLSVDVDPNGNVSNVQLISSSGYPVLDNTAIDRAWSWQFDSSENGQQGRMVSVPFELR